MKKIKLIVLVFILLRCSSPIDKITILEDPISINTDVLEPLNNDELLGSIETLN